MVAGRQKTGAPNSLLKEKGEISRGHCGERPCAERQGLGHQPSSEVVPRT